VLEKTDHCEWATSVVIIPKKNSKAVRICGDFRSTVNQAINVNRYPFSTVQDLFSQLSGVQKFTKRDLLRAYEKAEVNLEQQKLLTLNTHKGLYRINRLLYGISSAPAIFQKIMDIVLKGVDTCRCLLDDIIISGATDFEHLQTLEKF
jgi:hypothetical protein